MNEISDIALLPSGGLLLACKGELLQYKEGQCVQTIKHNASSLVTSLDSSQIITLRYLGDSSRYLLHRLDLQNGLATVWGEQSLASWSKTFTGARWYVAPWMKGPWEEGPLYALDSNAETPMIVAESEPKVYEPCEIQLHGQKLWVEMSSFGSTEYACYELPSLRRLSYQNRPLIFAERSERWENTRWQSPFPPMEHPAFLLCEPERVSLCGFEEEWSFELTPTPGLALPEGVPRGLEHMKSFVRQSQVSFKTFGCWAAVLFRHSAGSELIAFDVRGRKLLLRHTFKEAASDSLTMPTMHMNGTRLAAWTKTGEVFSVDLTKPEEQWVFQV